MSEKKKSNAKVADYEASNNMDFDILKLKEDIEKIQKEKKHIQDKAEKKSEKVKKKKSKKDSKQKKQYKYTSPKRVIIISIICIIALFGLTILAYKKFFSNVDLSSAEVIRDNVIDFVKEYGSDPAKQVKEFIDTVNETNSVLQVEYLDVGQGDCTLISCGGEYLLIDASLDEYGTYIQNYLQKKGIHRLDYVILTHYDWDHAGGMDVVLQKFDCENVFMPPYVVDSKYYRDVMLAVEARHYKIHEPIVGTSFKLGDATVTIIGPTDYKSETENDYSTSIIIRHGNNRFIFSADMQSYGETSLVEGSYDIGADVYKVNHHGSKTSTTDRFLDAVHPKYAVISCGRDNPYGHPHQSTLTKLRERHIKVFRTDEQGTVICISTGDDLYFNNDPSTTWKPGVVQK